MNALIFQTRRQFLTFGALVTGFTMSGLTMARAAAGAVVDTLRIRYNSIYRQDALAPLRKPQDNPEVQTMYQDYLTLPLSPMSERLLHTTYTDRSDRIRALEADGIKLTLKSILTKL